MSRIRERGREKRRRSPEFFCCGCDVVRKTEAGAREVYIWKGIDIQSSSMIVQGSDQNCAGVLHDAPITSPLTPFPTPITPKIHCLSMLHVINRLVFVSAPPLALVDALPALSAHAEAEQLECLLPLRHRGYRRFYHWHCWRLILGDYVRYFLASKC